MWKPDLSSSTVFWNSARRKPLSDGYSVLMAIRYALPVLQVPLEDQMPQRRMLRQLESTPHSFLQSISPGWPRRRECQLSLSSFHNLMKDWSLKSVGHSSFLIRKYSSKPKLGCHKSSLYTILHHHPQLPERVYLETKTFPHWMQAQSNFFFFFGKVWGQSIWPVSVTRFFLYP